MKENVEKYLGRNRFGFNQAVTIGTVIQLAAVLIMLAAGWCNLQKELALIRHDLDQLIYLNRQRQSRIDHAKDGIMIQNCAEPQKSDSEEIVTEFVSRAKAQRREEEVSGRVESNGWLLPVPLLPLIKPDVRVSRIRLSYKFRHKRSKPNFSR